MTRADELVIWGRANGLNVQKVIWAAHEVGRPYRRIDAGFGFGVVDTPEYGRINPNRRVPAIQDGDFELWESNAIVRYLCARYRSEFYPADLGQRMDAERWMDWQAGDVMTAYRPAYNVFTWRGDRYTRAVAEEALAKTIGLLGILDVRLAERAYVMGAAFTMADIPIGIVVHDLFCSGQEVIGLDHVKRWHDQLAGRPAARAAFVDARVYPWEPIE